MNLYEYLRGTLCNKKKKKLTQLVLSRHDSYRELSGAIGSYRDIGRVNPVNIQSVTEGSPAVIVKGLSLK